MRIGRNAGWALAIVVASSVGACGSVPDDLAFSSAEVVDAYDHPELIQGWLLETADGKLVGDDLRLRRQPVHFQLLKVTFSSRASPADFAYVRAKPYLCESPEQDVRSGFRDVYWSGESTQRRAARDKVALQQIKADLFYYDAFVGLPPEESGTGQERVPPSLPRRLRARPFQYGASPCERHNNRGQRLPLSGGPAGSGRSAQSSDPWRCHWIASSRRSSPQKSSLPTTKVGEPKMPSRRASSVAAL
jgi:hypothetical protein